MASTVSDFQTAFPEFGPYGFSAPAIQFWIDYAKVFLSEAIWGGPSPAGQPFTPYDYGVLWHAAHHISVALQNNSIPMVNPTTGAAIGAPGMTKGVTTQKSVDKVSVSSDVTAVMEDGAGHWNATSYGRMFARLAKQFGNAPLYIGAGRGNGLHAWAGPGYPFPGWFAW